MGSGATSQAAHDLPHTISQRSGTLFEALQLSQSQASGNSFMTTEALQARENIIGANANISSGKKANSVIVELKVCRPRGLSYTTAWVLICLCSVPLKLKP